MVVVKQIEGDAERVIVAAPKTTSIGGLMAFPVLSPAALLDRLTPPRNPVRMVLHTDTYHEIDDQFALTYALLSPERITVEPACAAPFHNERAAGPADGLPHSYDEIRRLLERLNRAHVRF